MPVQNKLSIKEKLEKELNKQFKEQYKEVSINEFVSNFLEENKGQILKSFLGFERSFGEIRFKYDSIITKELNKFLPSLAKDCIGTFKLDDINFTEKEILSLQRNYRRCLLEKINDEIEDYARNKARNYLDDLLENIEETDNVDNDEGLTQ